MCARATSNRNEQAQANISGRNIMEGFLPPLQTQEESISSCCHHATTTIPPVTRPFILYTLCIFKKNFLLHLKFFCLHLKFDGAAARPGVRVYLTKYLTLFRWLSACHRPQKFFLIFDHGEPLQNRSCPLFLCARHRPGKWAPDGFRMEIICPPLFYKVLTKIRRLKMGYIFYISQGLVDPVKSIHPPTTSFNLLLLPSTATPSGPLFLAVGI